MEEVCQGETHVSSIAHVIGCQGLKDGVHDFSFPPSSDMIERPLNTPHFLHNERAKSKCVRVNQNTHNITTWYFLYILTLGSTVSGG